MKLDAPSDALWPWATVWMIFAWIQIEQIGGHRLNDLLPLEIKLGDPCRSSMECLLFVQHSHCDWEKRVCTCQPYNIQYNDTACLPASLLGYACAVDVQCQLKVRHSQCVSGLCKCQPNHVPLRKDKCLPPAKIGDYCLNDRQCHLVSSYSFCKYIIPRVYGKCQCPLGYLITEEDLCLPHLGSDCESDEDCQMVTPNSYCHRKGFDTKCTCTEGFNPSKNGLRCEPEIKPEGDFGRVDPISLGKPCNTTYQCRARDPYSTCTNGICDCVMTTPRCNAGSTGCHNDTFQCRSGHCISWYYLCDKQSNCPDGSDEDECIPYNCPKQAFQCNDGTCISRALVCNGHWECPDGSDEGRCYTGIPCDPHAFRCASGRCLPQYTFCNAVQDCLDASDEQEQVCDQGENCLPDGFLCKNNRCRSTAILCSGVDGCGDNSDETDCDVCYCEKPTNEK